LIEGEIVSKVERIVIIGAGIGGLTAACALRQNGFEVEVYERSPELGEVGAGLQIGPNAVKVLNALGLEDRLRRIAAEPDETVSVRWDDASLRYREPLKAIAQAEYGARYLTAHRADLHRLLIELLPESSIHLGRACVGAELVGRHAVARFADGSAVEADLVVGADGIRSAVRESLFGADQPRFTQQMCWRGIVPIERVPTRIGPGGGVRVKRDDFVGWLGPNGHVICYPIRGGELYNIFAGHVSEDWVDESWTVPSSREEILAGYAGWNEALLGMLGQTERCFKWGICDRDPLLHWTKGQVTLLGDAAHPMMPTLAQGAAITIEDGYALARNLASSRNDMAQALAAYDAERVPRASRVQLQARQQFENNRMVPAPPPLDRGWIFRHDATKAP
jgi:salicylate hydroxylase